MYISLRYRFGFIALSLFWAFNPLVFGIHWDIFVKPVGVCLLLLTLRDAAKRRIRIAVFGVTGAGKSSLIKTITGNKKIVVGGGLRARQ
jgi:hypothetical protein